MVDWKSMVPIATMVIVYIGGVSVWGKIMLGIFKSRIEDLRNEYIRDYDRLELKNSKLESKVDELCSQLSEVKIELEKANKFIDKHNYITSR